MNSLGELLTSTRAELAAAGLDEAGIKAEWLLAGLLGVPRWTLQAEPGRDVDPAALPRVRAAVDRLKKREPLSYVLGAAEFHGRVFRSDRRALIPRPETEELVEHVLSLQPVWDRPQPVVADVGTGTGCIALTLALERPEARVTGIDLDPSALELAHENGALLGNPRNLRWRLGDLLQGVPPASLDLVVSNPPYVSEAEWRGLEPELRHFEPWRALVAGATGLEILERLAAEAAVALRPGGVLVCEIGSTQGDAVAALLRRAGFEGVEVRRDLAGNPRIARGHRP